MIDSTRRDYLVAKALAYAIIAMQTLPYFRRELSDEADMKVLFDTLFIRDGEHEQLMKEARAKFLVEPSQSESP